MAPSAWRPGRGSQQPCFDMTSYMFEVSPRFHVAMRLNRWPSCTATLLWLTVIREAMISQELCSISARLKADHSGLPPKRFPDRILEFEDMVVFDAKHFVITYTFSRSSLVCNSIV